MLNLYCAEIECCLSVAGWIALVFLLIALLGEAVISGMAIHGVRTVRFKIIFILSCYTFVYGTKYIW